ncbi:hypothetical protein ACFPK9_07970 [Rubritalea spongiae]|uniref:Uncharacterized protein n=1 Tax=Rubritalea spongiae TaxID=430797 RepID=A0ABW5E5Y2_9BACT
MEESLKTELSEDIKEICSDIKNTIFDSGDELIPYLDSLTTALVSYSQGIGVDGVTEETPLRFVLKALNKKRLISDVAVYLYEDIVDMLGGVYGDIAQLDEGVLADFSDEVCESDILM